MGCVLEKPVDAYAYNCRERNGHVGEAHFWDVRGSALNH